MNAQASIHTPQLIPTRVARAAAVLRNILLGDAQPAAETRFVPGDTGALGTRIDVLSRPGAAPESEKLLAALRQAIQQYDYDVVAPYRSHLPEEVFAVNQIVLVKTDDNAALFGSFERLMADQKRRIAQAQFKDQAGLDASALVAVRIQQAAAGGTDSITVLAGSGPQRARLEIEFHGEWVSKAALTPTKSAPIEPPQQKPTPAPRQAQTPDPLQAATAWREATTCMPSAPTEPVAATLTIREPGQAERLVDVRQLPATIGRSEADTVQLDNAFASRNHLRLTRCPATGALRVSDHSRLGTLRDGKPLVRGEEVALSTSQTLVLAPTADNGGTVIVLRLAAGLAAVPAPSPAPKQVASIAPKIAAKNIVVLAINTCAKPIKGLTKNGSPSHTGIGFPIQVADEEPQAPAAQTLMAAPSAHTLMVPDNPAASSQACAIAVLHIQSTQGSPQRVTIYSLPFTLGRELPAGETGHAIYEVHSKVSRAHLRIEKLQAGAFVVQNLAHNRAGTFVAGQRQGERFVAEPAKPGAKNGWIHLGEASLTEKSVAIKLEIV